MKLFIVHLACRILLPLEKIRGLNRLARSRTERPDAPLHLDLERRVEERQPKSRTGVVGSCHVILLQEAESHFHEIEAIAAEQFHIYQGADQLTMFHKNTFELGGVKTDGETPGTSKQDSLVPDTPGGQVPVQEALSKEHARTHLPLFT